MIHRPLDSTAIDSSGFEIGMVNEFGDENSSISPSNSGYVPLPSPPTLDNNTHSTMQRQRKLSSDIFSTQTAAVYKQDSLYPSLGSSKAYKRSKSNHSPDNL